MKKITFVEKDDDSSYDPVSTFFTRKTNVSVPKSQNSSVKQNNIMTKTAFEKNIIQKKQQQKFNKDKVNLQPDKIGQKGGSGYIPKKIPNSTQKIQNQTIYNFKQQFDEDNQKIQKDQQGRQKKYKQPESKPDMVFDIPNYQYEQSEFQTIKTNKKQKDLNNENKKTFPNKFPQIKGSSSKKQVQRSPQQFEQQQIAFDNTNKLDKRISNNNKEQQIGNKKSNKQILSKNSRQNTRVVIQNKNVNNQVNKKPQNLVPTNNKPQVPQKNLTTTNQNSIKNTQSVQSNKRVNQAAKQSKELKNPIQKVQFSSQQPSQQQPSQQQQQQLYQKQYQRKIQDLQARIQTLTKIQQKYNKLVRQHKLCNEKNKQNSTLKQQLKQQKQSIKKLLSQDNIPFNKKRQYLLLNQMNQLRRMNRQLVLRIKSYKGTDLVQMAINKNREQIGREFDIDYHEEYNKLNTEMESNLTLLIGKVYEYLQSKCGKSKNNMYGTNNSYGKNQQHQQKKDQSNYISFQNQHNFLLQINKIAEKISLTYLDKYEISPIPKCNQDAMNIYAQIQKQKQSILSNKRFVSLVDKEDINFAITQSNLEILNDIEQNQAQIAVVKQQVLHQGGTKPQVKLKSPITNNQFNQQQRPNTSHGHNSSSTLLKPIIKKLSLTYQILKRRSSISSAFHIQSICYFTFMKQVVDNMLSKMKQELVNLYGRLKQLKDIFDLGGNTAKQSLYLYLQTNIQNFCLVVPNFLIKIKEIKSSYKEISRGIQRKAMIKGS